MARPPVLAAEEKVRVVVSILAGEMTVAEASLVAGSVLLGPAQAGSGAIAQRTCRGRHC